MDKGNTEHGWIAVVNKVCAGNIDIDGVGETEGESDNDSVTEERATDVEEKEDDKAVEEDQHYELLLFGLSCNHPISVYKLNSKPNSATFCSCIEDGGQRKTSLLLVTENCELLKLSPVVAEKSVHYGQVAFVKRPSLPEIILNKPLVAANDRSDHLAVVDEALAAYLEGRRDNQTVVPSYQNWLSNLMGDTTSAVSVVGSVATDFMDSLLPKRNHQVLSSSGNSVSAPETSYRNGVNPRDPARQGEIGTNEKLVESCLNFGKLTVSSVMALLMDDLNFA